MKLIKRNNERKGKKGRNERKREINGDVSRDKGRKQDSFSSPHSHSTECLPQFLIKIRIHKQ
jgi:hypothetical protein